MEPSHFVEDADSLELMVDRVSGSSGNWHPDEAETTFPPRRRHNSLEPKVDRVVRSLGELLQDGKQRQTNCVKKKIRSSRRWIE
ncbi:hypothetical protein Trydic_g3243 [Trypoxylus dichotomus]